MRYMELGVYGIIELKRDAVNLKPTENPHLRQKYDDFKNVSKRL